MTSFVDPTTSSTGTAARRIRSRSASLTLRTAAKRTLDVVISVIACLITLPVLLALLAAVRLDSHGSPLFRQTRIGRNGRAFTMYKLRTMQSGCDVRPHEDYVRELLTGADPRDENGDRLYKLAGDSRVTRVGRFLRRSSLDELPQLLNVLRGDMSLVGPRPSLPYEVPLMDARHLARFEVPPGITGLWQVSGRNRLPMLEALELDVTYVTQWTLREDLRILLRTVPAVLARACR